MLGVLAGGSVRPSALWNRERVSKPTVTNSVDYLVRHGHLVRTDPNLNDRRSHRIAATPAGERAVAQVLALMEERAERLSDDQLRVLHEAVGLIEFLAEEEPLFRLSSSFDRLAVP
jgi:DNA-binding MarR family transcriptional regulator